MICAVKKKRNSEFNSVMRYKAMGAALKAGILCRNAIREAEKILAPMYEENVRIRKNLEKWYISLI